jgi:thiol-disulfide isomerase/thioredoxin
MITLGAQERWVYDGVVGQNKLTFKIEGLGDYLEKILNADVESRPKMYKLSTDHTQPFYQDDWDYEKEEIVPSVQSSILTVTANTFDEVVTNGNRDVFMMFAAPWCIHCIAFLEFYEPIAKKHLKSKSGPIIAHMDAERNNLSDDFDIQGYPSFFWIPKNGGTPTRYTGGHIDAEGVEEFLQTMRKH